MFSKIFLFLACFLFVTPLFADAMVQYENPETFGTNSDENLTNESASSTAESTLFTTPSSASSNGGSSSSSLRSSILVTGGGNSANGGTNVTLRDNFLKNIERYMIGLLGIIAVSMFVYIGFRLVTARGNEEEFKKAWIALLYAVLWLALVPLAYILVKIVSGFTL